MCLCVKVLNRMESFDIWLGKLLCSYRLVKINVINLTFRFKFHVN